MQECGVGLVPLSVATALDGHRLTLQMPAKEYRTLTSDEVEELNEILDHPVHSTPAPSVVDVGAIWVVAQLEGADTLLLLKPDFAHSAGFEHRLGATGLSLLAGMSMGFETRSFTQSCGVNADPVCGRGTASRASFRLKTGQIAPGDSYVARQRLMKGRDGFVHL